MRVLQLLPQTCHLTRGSSVTLLPCRRSKAIISNSKRKARARAKYPKDIMPASMRCLKHASRLTHVQTGSTWLLSCSQSDSAWSRACLVESNSRALDWIWACNSLICVSCRGALLLSDLSSDNWKMMTGLGLDKTRCALALWGSLFMCVCMCVCVCVCLERASEREREREGGGGGRERDTHTHTYTHRQQRERERSPGLQAHRALPQHAPLLPQASCSGLATWPCALAADGVRARQQTRAHHKRPMQPTSWILRRPRARQFLR